MPLSNPRPKWWQLYLTFPLLVVLFILETRLRISQSGHQLVQLGILLLVYGLIHLWLKSNAKALSALDRVRVMRVPIIHAYPLPDDEKRKRPIFRLPDSEIKGTLSDTFEADYIDAEFVSPRDEIAQELKKE